MDWVLNDTKGLMKSISSDNDIVVMKENVHFFRDVYECK